MEKQQTAVEWLVDEFKEKLTGSDLPGWVLEIINQAKQMEKEQIIQAAQWMTPTYADAELYYEYNYKNHNLWK